MQVFSASIWGNTCIWVESGIAHIVNALKKLSDFAEHILFQAVSLNFVIFTGCRIMPPATYFTSSFPYSQVPNKRPPILLIFGLFPNPPDPIRTTPFINFKEIEFITGLLCYFLSFLVLFMANFQGKLTFFFV